MAAVVVQELEKKWSAKNIVAPSLPAALCGFSSKHSLKYRSALGKSWTSLLHVGYLMGYGLPPLIQCDPNGALDILKIRTCAHR